MTLLSICIPTYNRSAYIRETLASVSRQWATDLEVCISDNGSTDSTASVVAEYADRLGMVKYYRWEANQGADRNYLKAVSLASGEYCWLLGSDDTVVEGALNRLRQSLLIQRPDIVLFNRVLCDRDMNPVKEEHFLNLRGDRQYDFSVDGELAAFLRAARSICATFSYLSAAVFRKSAWDAIEEDDRFIGTAYIHVHKHLSTCRAGARLSFIDEALVNCRLGNDSFRDMGLAKRVLLDLRGYSALTEALFGRSQPECADALRAAVLKEYPFWRIMRLRGVIGLDPDWAEIVTWLKFVYRYPGWALSAALLLGSVKPLVRISFWARDFIGASRRLAVRPR